MLSNTALDIIIFGKDMVSKLVKKNENEPVAWEKRKGIGHPERIGNKLMAAMQR